MEGHSVAVSSSSFKMTKFISLISLRNVWIRVREFRVSSVLELSLHCSIPVSILEAVLCIVSFTFQSPCGDPCVFHVKSRLSHALVVSSILSREKKPPLFSLATQEGALVSYLISFYDVFVCELGCRHSFQWFYTWVSRFPDIFYVHCMEVSRVFVKQLDPSRHCVLSFTINSFRAGQ